MGLTPVREIRVIGGFAFSARRQCRLRRCLFALLLCAAAAFALLLGFAAGAVGALDELDQRHRRRIAMAVAELGDAGVPARPSGEPRRDVVEELLDDGATAHESRR